MRGTFNSLIYYTVYLISYYSEHIHSKHSVIVNIRKTTRQNPFTVLKLHIHKNLVGIKDNPVFVWNLHRLNETSMFSSGVGHLSFSIKKNNN